MVGGARVELARVGERVVGGRVGAIGFEGCTVREEGVRYVRGARTREAGPGLLNRASVESE